MKGKDRPKPPVYDGAKRFPYGKRGGGKDNALNRRLQETTACRACGQVGHWESDGPQRAYPG